MSPGAIAVFALLYAGGVILAGNVRTAATLAGNYLIGKRRLGFIRIPHRREVMTRAFGCLLCMFSAETLAGVISGGARWWMSLLAAIAGLVPPVALWWRTASHHGRDEVPDEQGTRSIFGGEE